MQTVSPSLFLSPCFCQSYHYSATIILPLLVLLWITMRDPAADTPTDFQKNQGFSPSPISNRSQERA